MSILSYEVGLTYATRVNVETLGVVPNMAPAGLLYPYSETLQTGSLGGATRGYPYGLWNWQGMIYLDMFNALRVICPGATAAVVIRTLNADHATFGYYSGIMRWPALDTFEWLGGRGIYRGFSLRFDALTSYTP